jgi:hypothetical protein
VPGPFNWDQTGEPVTATFERLSDYLLKYDVGSVQYTLKPD